MPHEINLKLLHVTWDDLQELTESLAGKIMNDEFKPDIIVAVSRGGFDPARILCDQLDVRRLASLQVEYYKGINEVNKEPQILYPLNAGVQGLRVLLVDDVSDSGTSLKAALEHIQAQGAEDLKIATVHIKPWTTFIPDYYSENVDRWIVYPWEPIESMNSMANKLLSMNIPEEDIPKTLLDLGFSKKYLCRLTLRK